MKRKKITKLTTVLMLGLIVATNSSVYGASLKPATGGTSAFAEENQYNEISSRVVQENRYKRISTRATQAKPFVLPGGQGTLTANAWRSQFFSQSGNTYQWDYQVSAVYRGNKTVESIKTSWYGGASLRNSASINLGVSNSGATVGAGSSWQYTNTPVKYWENTNGATRADYRSNLVVSPSRDYRYSTISLTNTARVKLKGDPKPYEITAGV